ncbi:MAG: ImmA/IrrE family metallo-endopeptidase [Emcibacter sp.]|nr:ImmA/IrrE family metallo-endopeptidase [Emcibacter sp.]
MENIATWKPESTGYSKKYIHELAEYIAEKLSFEPGGDIYTVVKKQLNGEIVHRDFWGLTETNDGSIEISNSGKINISLPSYVSETRNRFTIAHELGHYFLHYLPNLSENSEKTFKATRYTEESNERSEWEANWFAAAFLMPSNEFKEYLKKYDTDIDIIAEHFNVSRTAAKYHAEYITSL